MVRHVEGTLSALLGSLVGDAIRRDVPLSIAEEARIATTRRFGAGEAALTPGLRRRVEAYFSATVRRRAVRRGVAPRAAARFVVATVVEDLRAAGRDGASIWDELERGWNGAVPPELLEEYRLRLCG